MFGICLSDLNDVISRNQGSGNNVFAQKSLFYDLDASRHASYGDVR